MKTFASYCALLTLAWLTAAGCTKADKTPPAPMINGVKADFPKLQRTFAAASPEIQKTVFDATSGVRYGMYEKSLEALDKLANDPSVTPEQKQVVNELIDAVKQLLAKSPPSAAPQ